MDNENIQSVQNTVKTRTEKVKAWAREHSDQAIIVGGAIFGALYIAASRADKRRAANKQEKKLFNYIDKKNESGSTVVITEQGVWFSPPVPRTPTFGQIQS